MSSYVFKFLTPLQRGKLVYNLYIFLEKFFHVFFFTSSHKKVSSLIMICGLTLARSGPRKVRRRWRHKPAARTSSGPVSLSDPTSPGSRVASWLKNYICKQLEREDIVDR